MKTHGHPGYSPYQSSEIPGGVTGFIFSKACQETAHDPRVAQLLLTGRPLVPCCRPVSPCVFSAYAALQVNEHLYDLGFLLPSASLLRLLGPPGKGRFKVREELSFVCLLTSYPGEKGPGSRRLIGQQVASGATEDVCVPAGAAALSQWQGR